MNLPFFHPKRFCLLNDTINELYKSVQIFSKASSTPDIDENKQQSYDLQVDEPLPVPDNCTTTDTTSNDLEESISKLEETLQEINQDLENDSDNEAPSPTAYKVGF